MSVMESIRLKDRKQTKTEEEVYVALPEYHTVLGTDLDMVCTLKRLNDNTIKYICTSERNQVLRYLVLHILDHCIDQIHIISGGRSGSGQLALFDDVLKNKFDDYHSLIYEPIYDKNTGEPFKVAFKRTQIAKPYTDSEKLKEFLITIRNELKDFHSFEIFRNVIFEVKLKMKEAQRLFKQTIENQIKMKDLKLALVTQGRDSRLEIHRINQAYSAASDTVQELLFKNLIQSRYAKAYENSRFEQNKIKCERELRELQNIISKYKNQIEKETRVHNEILNYINDNEKDLKESTAVWIQNYNSHMETSHVIILQIKDRLEEVQKFNEKLKNLFADHKKSIEDFKEYKDRKHKKEEEEQRLIGAATKIQAWWRGTMYRHQLGPYNPNKSKKDKNKKKKKK